MKAISVVVLFWAVDASAFSECYQIASPMEQIRCIRQAMEEERERREEFWREQEMQDLEFRIERLEQDF